MPTPEDNGDPLNPASDAYDAACERSLSEPAKYTPGPWRWELPRDEWDDQLERLIGADGTEVCNFGNSETYYPITGDAPAAADRALIETAPDMAALLEKLASAERRHMANEDELYPDEIMVLMDEVREILAKVKGGTSV